MNPTEQNGTSARETPAPRPRSTAPLPDRPAPRLSLLAIIIVIAVLLAVVAGMLPRWRQRTRLIGETKELGVANVNVVSAVPGRAVSTLTLPAEIRAVVEAPIYARASGFVKKWYVDIGSRVKSGDALVDIDTPELDQELSGARAVLAQAEATLALARTTADRWADLLKTSSVSEQENAEKQADLKLKLANVDAAKANVHRYEDLQSFTHVTAPFPGTLTARLIDVGDLIGSGRELFRLADTDKLRIFVRVPQSATPSIATGLTAELAVPEIPGRTFTAKVVRTAGAIDTTSRTLLTELEVDNAKHEILAGSYAQVSFGELRADPALVLPSNTLLFRAEGTQVGVVEADGQVLLHKVTLGRDFGRTLEILAGVKAGDRVIVNPSDSLVSGAAVRIASNNVAGNPK